jgi:hypothetical protein
MRLLQAVGRGGVGSGSAVTRWALVLGAAGAGVLAMGASPARAGDTDVRIGIDFDFGRPRRPVPVETCEWVWVEPVYRTVYDRVWIPPVTRTIEERVWIPERVEEREVVRYRNGRRCVEVVRIVIEPGHYETRCREVEVSCGRWDTVARQELVCAGYWKEVRRPVYVYGQGDTHDYRGRSEWGRDRGRHDDGDRHEWSRASYDRGDRYDRGARH